MPTRDLALLITAACGLSLLPGFIARFFPAPVRPATKAPGPVPGAGYAAPKS